MQQNYQLKSLVEENKSKEDWYKEEISQLEEAISRNDSKKCDRAKEIELKEKVWIQTNYGAVVVVIVW